MAPQRSISRTHQCANVASALMLALTLGSVGIAMTANLSGKWRPSHIGSIVVPSETKIFIQFMTNNRIAGHGGCNRLSGPYAVSDHTVTIGPIASTRMICPKSVMDLETAFISAVERAKTFQQDGTKLVLQDAAMAEILQFVQID